MEFREPVQQQEIQDLSDEHYMGHGLDLLNWRAGDVPDHANFVWRRLTTDTSAWTLKPGSFRLDPTVEVNAGALAFGKRLRADVDLFLSEREKMRKALAAIADSAIEQVKVRTQLRRSERGTLVHLHSYTAGEGDGPRGLFLSFLLDPDRRFASDLRRCRLASCNRYFFVPSNRKGGRIPSYCPGTDHQRRDDALRNAPKRARDLRKRKAAAAKRE